MSIAELRELVARGIYDLDVGKKFFFGENSVICRAAVDALRSESTSDLEDVLRDLQCQKTSLRQIYGPNAPKELQ